MGKTQSFSTKERAQIVNLSNLKFSVRQVAKKKKKKVSKTVLHNAIMKYYNEGVFIDRKRRSGRPRATTSREHHLIRKAVTHSPISTSTPIQGKLIETSTAVSTKTIQRDLSLEFGLKSCKPTRKPRLTQSMKKKRLDFATRHASWDIDIEIKSFFYL